MSTRFAAFLAVLSLATIAAQASAQAQEPSDAGAEERGGGEEGPPEASESDQPPARPAEPGDAEPGDAEATPVTEPAPAGPVLPPPVVTEVPPPAPIAPAVEAKTRAEVLGWDQKHPVGPGNIYYKPGKGLTAVSDDELFKLETRVRGQLLYEVEAEDDEEAEQSFNIRRMRVVFSGHAWGEQNTFKLELALSPQDLGIRPDLVDFDGDGEQDASVVDDNPVHDTQRVGRAPLLDFYVQFKQVRDLNVRVGQYKIPFSRQRVISSGDLMFVDRSIVNSEFTLDRDLGFDLRSKDLFGLGGTLRYYVGVYTGEGHSSFASRPISSADRFFGLNTLVRIELLPFGDFNDYKESDLERSREPQLSIGATFAHIGDAQSSRGVLGRPPADDGTTDFLMGEADAMFKFRGLSVQGEFMIREGRRNVGSSVADYEAPRDGWGLMGQAGYLTPRNVELAVRHAAVRGASNGSLSDGNETGMAFSYYVAGHPYKIQADYFRLYTDSWSEGAHQVRAQLQFSL